MTKAPVRQVRLADVARIAGVGNSVASRVLNGDATLSVRPETRERILTAARDLNYRPNAFARGLKLARTMTLGLVIPNLAYPVNAEIIRGAERRAVAAGYVVLLADSEEFLEAGVAFERLLGERRVDGLLIASASTDEALVRALAGAGLPFVLVNRRVARVGPTVTVDDVQGMKIAVEYLIALGHRRIGYIGGPGHADTARRRLMGFRTAMREAHLRAPSMRLAEAPFDEEGGFRAMCRSSSRMNPARQPLPSGALPPPWVPSPPPGDAASMFQRGSPSLPSMTLPWPPTSIPH
jgi:DNA-binding LacI/PurR family transcriptional regulator